jgi:hypothetical protein
MALKEETMSIKFWKNNEIEIIGKIICKCTCWVYALFQYVFLRT